MLTPTAPEPTIDLVRRYSLLAAAALALLAWLMPNHGVPWSTFLQESAMALAGLLAAACVLRWRATGGLAVPRLAWLAVATATIPIAQAAAGLIVFRGDAVMACLYLAGFALAQIVGLHAVQRWGIDRPLQALAGVFLIGALTSVTLALCQWQQLDQLGFVLSDLPENARPFANMNQPNLLASLLVLGLLSVAVLFDAGHVSGFGGALAVGLMGFGIAMTQSRAALLECAVVAALLLSRHRALDRRLRRSAVVAGLALVLTMGALWQVVRDIAPQAPAARNANALLELGERGTHWQAMLDAIGRQPWLGYGWGQGAAAQYAVAPDHPAALGVFDYAHNIVLDLLVWNGVPLGVLIIAALALWAWAALRAARDSRSVLALACVAAVAAHAMVEYPLYYSFFLLPIGALVGGIGATGGRGLWTCAPRWSVQLLLGALCVGMGLVSIDYLALEKDVQALRYERARVGVDRARHALSEPLVLTQVGAFTRFARTPERRNMSATELQAMADVVHRYPSGENVIRYAAALAINDQPAAAVENLSRVCKLNSPACDTFRELWGRLGTRYPEIAALAWP